MAATQEVLGFEDIAEKLSAVMEKNIGAHDLERLMFRNGLCLQGWMHGNHYFYAKNPIPFKDTATFSMIVIAERPECRVTYTLEAYGSISEHSLLQGLERVYQALSTASSHSKSA